MATLMRAVRQKVRPAAYRVRRAPPPPRAPAIQAAAEDLPPADLSALILYGQA